MTFEDDVRIGDEARLWRLIEQRAEEGADVSEIDARIWELFGETWAIMFTDLEGFSRKTERFGIIHFLQVILTSKRLLYPVVMDHLGLVIKSEGDSLMLLFRTAERALRCAVAMQHTVQMASQRMVPEDQVILSIGVGYGELLRIGSHDVFGREVNAASKLGEDTAAPHEILVTEAVHRAVGELDGVGFEPIRQEVPGSTSNYRVVYEVGG